MLFLSINTVLGEGHSQEKFRAAVISFNFSFVLTDLRLTCRKSCCSSCGSWFDEDCVVHAGEPMVSEGRRQSAITSCIQASQLDSDWSLTSLFWLSDRTGAPLEYNHKMNKSACTEIAPSPGQREQQIRISDTEISDWFPLQWAKTHP